MTAAPKGVLVLALIAVLASVWLFLATLRNAAVVDEARQHPDVSVEAPHWQLFDTGGEIEQEIHASRLEQWTAQEPALLFEPRMELRDQRDRRWLLSAQRGRTFPDQGPIHLEQDVLLRDQQPDATVDVETSHLEIARSGDRISTDAPVVLRTGNWHFSALGLRADLGQQRIELLEQVKATHE
ncbi:MAG: LPS export ABC transporter periplasmic protein LptC [Thiogranum sp.]|nr:LPS export ABC transporter periplasmic protein LptC [Thiogranum sp.]